MKSSVAAGIAVAAIAAILAIASRPSAPAKSPADDEFTRFRETHSRLLESISARLDRIDAETRAGATSDKKAEGILEVLSRRLDGVASEFHAADGSLRSLRDAVARLKKSGDPDARQLGKSVLHPSVQVTARGGVGGGTLVRSAAEISQDYGSYVLTAFHVVQKAIDKDENGKERRLPVQVRLYREDGTPGETIDSDLILSDERRDLALLKLRSTKSFPNAAHLATRERIREMTVFSPIYAVGCPLGHDPLPSFGEITTLRKEVNGERFWMMNAPTIFGNSGGGVFHRESMEMIGVSAMICTFDNPVTTPVPHLGILVPLDAVYDWLRKNHYEFIFDASFSYDRCERERVAALAPIPPPMASAAKARVDW